MCRKKVFVSYDHKEDVHYKELLKAWDINENFHFIFDSRSPNVSFESTNESVIYEAFAKEIKESEYILLIIGKDSHKSKWMKWEISQAKKGDNKLKFAAVKIEKNYFDPVGLPFPATSFAIGFSHENIMNALNQARNSY